MPLDTRLPLLAGQFKPITYQAPSQANMLAEVAQAAQAVQGLEAGREERQARLAGQQRATQTQAALQEARKLGYTDEAMLSMSDALIGSGVPDLVNKGITLRESLREAAEYRRAFGGGGAPAGAAAMPAPAGAVATPAPAGVGAPQLTSGVNERGLAFPTTQEGRNQAWADIQAGKPMPPAMSPVTPLQSIVPTTPAAPVAGPGNAMAARAPVANQLAAQPPAEGNFLQTAEAAVDPNAPQRARLAQLLQHPQKNIREAAAASLAAMPGVTSEQKAYLTAVRQGFRGTMMEYETALKKAGASTQNVNVSAERAEKVARAQQLVKDYDQVSQTARNARRSLMSIEGAQRVLEKGFTTGFGTETIGVAASVLAALGVPAAEKYATNSQTFLSEARKVLLDRQLEQKGPQTENDAKRIDESFVRLGNTTAANKFILAVAKAQAEMASAQQKQYSAYYRKNGTYDGAEEEWLAGEGSKSIFDHPSMKQFAGGSAESPAGRPSLEQILGPRPAAPGR
jgi:hypothetical protein